MGLARQKTAMGSRTAAAKTQLFSGRHGDNCMVMGCDLPKDTKSGFFGILRAAFLFGVLYAPFLLLVLCAWVGLGFARGWDFPTERECFPFPGPRGSPPGPPFNFNV